MVAVVTERDFMSNMQRIDKRMLYILLGIDMKTNALAGLTRFCDQYDSLFAGRLSSIKVTRYSRVEKFVQRKGKIYCQ